MAGITSPWKGNNFLTEDDPLAWQGVSPTERPMGGYLSHRVPREMSIDDIEKVKRDFVEAAIRARDVGFQWVVLHFAHSYLLQNFFSPLVNQRTDKYGGSFENRARLLIEIVERVRVVWPERLPLTARLGVKDFVEGEQPIEESVELVRLLRERGLDLIDVSMGMNRPAETGIPFNEDRFMVPFARQIRKEVGIPTATSWNLGSPLAVDELIRSEAIDLVMLGKSLLADPNWAFHAAEALRRDKPQFTLPVQYAVWLRGIGELIKESADEADA